MYGRVGVTGEKRRVCNCGEIVFGLGRLNKADVFEVILKGVHKTRTEQSADWVATKHLV
jgi:hypothetical protein